MRKFHFPAATQWASWGVSALLVITAVMPVLPAGTPQWVKDTLVIVAVILTALTTRAGDKPRIEPPVTPPADGPSEPS